MISLLRVDNRMIHGQVVSTWIPHLRAEQVVVVDDAAAASPLMQAAMSLALPPLVTSEILRFDEVDWKALSRGPKRVLVLVRDVEGAVEALARGAEVAHVNLGNVHFAAGRKPVSPSVFLSEAELALLEEMAGKGIEVEARAVPTDHRASLRELEARLEAAHR
ncbi:PTS system mannose/fructose/N-acetylgalactosamine-transporter subunit IIB [Vulgatibacter incomptus]|uniref:PTS system, mannose-specific IIB component n=1 Tax=Vulgatibacter incomptus TaxID=1391653 RepID=A0A0K1PFE9_9BACT|nr:PTS sugar transporter subunit IIB [Vulgatibacter incomptus]AKU92227.1 PTS system, mannose-specific IIB component [Vulgatibacter incomptus]